MDSLEDIRWKIRSFTRLYLETYLDGAVIGCFKAIKALTRLEKIPTRGTSGLFLFHEEIASQKLTGRHRCPVETKRKFSLGISR
jgi:hypothetical protein